MNKYEKELQKLKSDDEVCGVIEYSKGYSKIITAGHGYLVVPRGDKNFEKAAQICAFGYIGKHAVYLEEDCELGEFLRGVK
jgi:hypothetical protein